MNSVSESIRIVNSNRSGQDVYDEVQEIAIEGITSQIEMMIESSDTFDGWVLSVKDGTRLVKILNSRKRIIKSSFKFQLKQNFSHFKSVPKTRFDQNLTRDRHSLKLTDADLAAEYQVLKLIIVGCEESYSEFYTLACQRLQHCVQRNYIRESENPVHVKRLCEAFQYSLDALNLDSRFQIAVYRLFSHIVIDNLALTYAKIDQCLISNSILPDLQIRKSEVEVLDSTTEAEIQIDSPKEQNDQDKREVDKEITSPIKAKPLEIAEPKEPAASEETNVVDLQVSKGDVGILDPATKAKTQIDSPAKQDEKNKPELEKDIPSSIKAKPVEIEEPKEPLASEEADVISNIAEPQLQQSAEKESLPLDPSDYAAEIQKGDWVEIMQKNCTKMAKLVWRSGDCSLFIFVDNTGNRIRELNGDQLNKEIEDGSINLVKTSSITSNRASLSVVQPFMGH